MTHFIKSKTGPKGRQTGYIVCADGKPIATFTNKQYGYWRLAKNAADRECDRLNHVSELVSV